ncbi:hypothetical protein LCGC14_2150000 [marine sediment metagenome]|uniref:Uncharacterized protein n=1 Tax=marine sediment metagenome TaxID=412755 RepID=A0A0F9G8T1_9ZZZZ
MIDKITPRERQAINQALEGYLCDPVGTNYFCPSQTIRLLGKVNIALIVSDSKVFAAIVYDIHQINPFNPCEISHEERKYIAPLEWEARGRCVVVSSTVEQTVAIAALAALDKKYKQITYWQDYL